MVDRIAAADFRAEALSQSGNGKAAKYRASPVTVDGIRFDSKREANYWQHLKLLEKAGEISDLRRQVVVPLVGRNGPLLTRTGRHMRITVDFGYTDTKTGEQVYADAKGMPTRDYEVRRAVAAAQGVEVLEV